ncbi:sulfite exporter TauE/SafE family protein [bacterium]|nr:sulfite exporter TauE/SafE family protein [bacterium]
MLSKDLFLLATAAASIGFFHTLLGPDHYLPFIVMSRSGQWSLKKTTWITLVCGIGHILSSVILGFLGIAFGIMVSKLEAFESFRGTLATWALIVFGFVYMIWGIRKAVKNQSHQHAHIHTDGDSHIHRHDHSKEHLHIHQKKGKKNMTPWVLFTIFVLGPCEPLIPMLMYPAAKNNLQGVWLVTGIFGGVTILTMLSIVLISTFGIDLIPTSRMERYVHAIAGATLFLCGLSIQFLGL